MVARHRLRDTLLPAYRRRVEARLLEMFEDDISVNVAVDIWTSCRVQGFLGITAHFVNKNYEVVNLFLCCQHITERHTGAFILQEYDQVITSFDLRGKVNIVVSDNAKNMEKAFTPVGFPGWNIGTENAEQAPAASTSVNDSETDLAFSTFDLLNLRFLQQASDLLKPSLEKRLSFISRNPLFLSATGAGSSIQASLVQNRNRKVDSAVQVFDLCEG